ncbi:unnamed protein product, partial [Oppiella nova]
MEHQASIVNSSQAFSCHHNVRENGTEFDVYNLDNFTNIMCARCYWYMADLKTAWKNDTMVNTAMNLSFYPDVMIHFLFGEGHDRRRINLGFNYSDLDIDNWHDDLFLQQFVSEFFKDTFLSCCSDAQKCCQKQIQASTDRSNTGPRCPAKWDGWMCWDSAPADSVQYQKCPPMSQTSLGYHPTDCANEYANKICLPNGTWTTKWLPFDDDHPEYGTYMDDDTDYNYCYIPEASEKLRQVQTSIGIFIFSLD